MTHNESLRSDIDEKSKIVEGLEGIVKLYKKNAAACKKVRITRIFHYDSYKIPS